MQQDCRCYVKHQKHVLTSAHGRTLGSTVKQLLTHTCDGVYFLWVAKLYFFLHPANFLGRADGRAITLSGRADDQAGGRTGERADARASGRADVRAGERTGGRTGERRTGGRANERADGRTCGQAERRSRARDQTCGRAGARASARTNARTNGVERAGRRARADLCYSRIYRFVLLTHMRCICMLFSSAL